MMTEVTGGPRPGLTNRPVNRPNQCSNCGLPNPLKRRFHGDGRGELPYFHGWFGALNLANRQDGTILPRHGCDHSNGPTQSRAEARVVMGTRVGPYPPS